MIGKMRKLGLVTFKLHRLLVTAINICRLLLHRLLASNETSYQDHSVTAGQQYFYKISQVYDGQESALSDAVSSTARAALEIAQVTFVDENLAACIAQAAIINGWGNTSDVTALACKSLNISDLTGLEQFTGLIELDLRDNSISDISAFATLTALSELKVSKNDITDISVLARLNALTFASLSDNQFGEKGWLA